MSDRNYYGDSRVRALDRWYKELDTRRMVATIVVHTFEDDCDTETDHEVPVVFEVCPTCSGKGTHVNPSIDCDGLTAEDFAEDPDFAEDYVSGLYDQPCNGCGGQRVVPVMDEENMDKTLLAQMRKQQDEDREYRAQCRYEQQMGY